MIQYYRAFSVLIYASFSLMLLYAPANAFDCAKAATVTENAICAKANLKSQDDAMTRVYFDLRKTLTKSAKSQLLEAQKSWLALRAGVCGGDSDCLLDETQLWTVRLNSLRNGMVPRVVWRDGGSYRYRIRIEGAIFANAANSAQKLFNSEIEAQIAQAPFSEVFEEGQSNTPEYEIFFDVSSSTNRLISGSAGHASYSGAHPSYWSNAINIDVRNGKLLTTDAVFSRQATRQLTGACREQIVAVKYQDEKGTLAQKLEIIEEEYPGIVARHVMDMKEWSISETAAEIRFDKYNIGSGAEGSYVCQFSISKIKSLANDPSLFSN